ncbi:MAG: alpha/beta hydrolase, partial [Myxococcales bacterium]|nr:alpha/beta hydrolase [Myxococcales bacterium]
LMDPDVFLRMLEQAGHHSAEDYLPEVSCPTIVIAAEKDTFTPPDLAARMAQQIPGAEFLMLRGASHAAPVEQPKRILQALEQVLLPTPPPAGAPDVRHDRPQKT